MGEQATLDLRRPPYCDMRHVDVEIEGRKISARFWQVPGVKRRDQDWTAILHGYQQPDPVGYGRTMEDAVASLLLQVQRGQGCGS